MHIYMSVGRMNEHTRHFDINKTVLVNPKTKQPNDLMKHRGELVLGDNGKYPAGSDPDSFKEIMARGGHIVVLSEKFLGTEYMLRKPAAVDPKAATAEK